MARVFDRRRLMIIEAGSHEKSSNERTATAATLFSVYMMVSMSAVMVGQYMCPSRSVRSRHCSSSAPDLFEGGDGDLVVRVPNRHSPLTQVKFDVSAPLPAFPPAAVVRTLPSWPESPRVGWLRTGLIATQLGLSNCRGWRRMLAIAMIAGRSPVSAGNVFQTGWTAAG